MEIYTNRIIKSNIESNKLISCCIFKMENSYRNFNKYVNKLENIIKNKNKYFKYFNFRIYTDKITYDDKYLRNTLSKYNDIEVFIYKCIDFMNNGYHVGTFGTIIRLLPFFEKNKYEIIIQIDVDLNNNLLEVMSKCAQEFIKSKAEFACKSYLCYVKPWIPINNKFNIINNFIATKIKFPISLLMDFLKELKNTNKNAENIFPYGTDEQFTNDVLYNYIQKNKVKTLLLKRFVYNSYISKLKKIFPPILNKKLLNEIRELEAKLYYNMDKKNYDEFLSLSNKMAKEILNKDNNIQKIYPKDISFMIIENAKRIINNYKKYNYPKMHIITPLR